MSELDNLMPTAGQTAAAMVGQSSEPMEVSNNGSAVNPYTGLSCDTMAYTSTNNQLLETLMENSFKANQEVNSLADQCDQQSTQLTFSDLTPPVPNVSTLESTRLLSVDTSLPTVDGVSDAVPESKPMLITQMSSISTEAPTIEIPTNDPMVPSMAPKDTQGLMPGVTDPQYSNMFQPVINGPSGSAPQTPDDSPIGPMEGQVPTVMPEEPMLTTTEAQPMPVLTTFESNTNSFGGTNVTADVYSVSMSQMVPVMSNNTGASVTSSDGPLSALGLDCALQEQLLDAIPPPSVNFPPGPVPMDEKGIPSALPGEFPMSLLPVEEEKVGGIESASVPLDKIEATINMNAKPVPTLTDAISVTQSEVNLIKSLPQSPQQSSAVTTTGSRVDITGQQQQQQYNLSYANQLQADQSQELYQSSSLQQVVTQDQLGPQPQQTVAVQQTSPPIESSHTIQTLTPLQPQQTSQVLTTEPIAPNPQSGSSSLVNVPEGQLPPPPAPPSATSIGVFETNPNVIMPDIVTQSQLTNVLPPPPPLQPVQSVNPIPEMNTLTNLVPVVEPTDPSLQQSCRPQQSVVIKSEPQSYSESDNTPNNTIGLNKVNDDNNNPIQNSSVREKERLMASNYTQPPLVGQMRGFPLCVISTTPTPYVSKNKTTIVAPKYELTLPPKKAKYASTGLAMSTPSSKIVSSTHAVPSSGMLYDLPHSVADHSSNMTPPFTTVSPILLSNLIPSVSVIDGPLSLVKEEKMRQLISATHPDYPAISGLLSFISPYHKPLTTSPMTTGQSPIGADSPISLSIKTSYNESPTLTVNSLSHSSHPSSHVPSLTRSSLHLNQSITSASSIVHSQPTSVPVSVVTSAVDHNRAFPQRIKSVAQNHTKAKINVEQSHPPGGTGVKLQLAPLLSGDPAKPFQCALCGKHLASKNVYQLHLRSHSGEKPFTCNLCGHSFSQKTSLTRHMRSHTGERPFPCQVCGKRFADKERIKIHMRTHTGEKPFACDICGKQFSQKSTVKRHMSVHTGEKPFKCETCGKGFANRGNLTAHTKTHSNS